MPRTRQIDPKVKYYPPRLMERLEYSKHYPMTLVEAPSGFGKTTILEHFLTTRLPEGALRGRYEFVRGRAREGWQQFCALIARVDPDCARKLRAIGPPDEDTLPDIAQALEGLACPEEAWLWLDDFTKWGLDRPGAFLDALSRHGGEGLHIVLTTQPLPKEKWGSLLHGGNLWHLREDSFAFQLEEIDGYFRAAGLSLTRGQLEEVGRLSEGWVMALRLQMANFVISGTFHPGGMDELMETVFWRRLTEEEQRFLLEIFRAERAADGAAPDGQPVLYPLRPRPPLLLSAHPAPPDAGRALRPPERGAPAGDLPAQRGVGGAGGGQAPDAPVLLRLRGVGAAVRHAPDQL